MAPSAVVSSLGFNWLRRAGTTFPSRSTTILTMSGAPIRKTKTLTYALAGTVIASIGSRFLKAFSTDSRYAWYGNLTEVLSSSLLEIEMDECAFAKVVSIPTAASSARVNSLASVYFALRDLASILRDAPPGEHSEVETGSTLPRAPRPPAPLA